MGDAIINSRPGGHQGQICHVSDDGPKTEAVRGAVPPGRCDSPQAGRIPWIGRVGPPGGCPAPPAARLKGSDV